MKPRIIVFMSMRDGDWIGWAYKNNASGIRRAIRDVIAQRKEETPQA